MRSTATPALLSLALLASSSADNSIRRLRRVVAIEDINKNVPEDRTLDADYYDGNMAPVASGKSVDSVMPTKSAMTSAESTKIYGMFDVVDDMWTRMMEAMSMSMPAMSMDMSMPSTPTMAPVPMLTSLPTVDLISPGNETSSPTSAPVDESSTPTSSPTTAPLLNLTSAPTEAPVVNLTSAPTTAPVVDLSSVPTTAPVVNLSSVPTTAPVVTLTATPTSAPVLVTQAPVFEIPPCFNSTTDIILAQLLDPPVKDIKICAGTTITIGIPSNADFTEFAGGDIPLTALHDDVTIQCGDNGNPDDECVITGGYVQFVTEANNPFVPDRNITTNNLLLKGLTFTGQLISLPGFLTTSSIGVSTPGSGMVIEDCVFDGLTAYSVFTNIGSILSGREEYPYFSSDLTVQRCVFNDIVYGASVILNDGQKIKMTEVVFNNITYGDFGTTTYGLVSSVGGITELSSSSFGASEVVTAAAFWWDISPTAVASTFEYSNNADLGVSFVVGSGGAAVNATDTCPQGLMKVDLVGATIECLALFS